MSKLKILFALIFGTVLILLMILFFTFVNSFGPEIHKGEDARPWIKGYFSAELPPSAGELYYYDLTFQDSITYIGMTIQPGEAWPFIKKFTGKSKRYFKKTDYIPTPFDMKDEKLWDPESLKKPLYYKKVVGEGTNKAVTAIYYDETTGRLLLSYCTY